MSKLFVGLRSMRAKMAKVFQFYAKFSAYVGFVLRVFNIYNTGIDSATIEKIQPGKKYSVLTIRLSIAFVMIPIYQHLSTLKLYR